VPRELRHTFVSLLSAHGVPVEAIALLAGHNQTATTELVYRHQIVPAQTRGAEVMDQIFGELTRLSLAVSRRRMDVLGLSQTAIEPATQLARTRSGAGRRRMRLSFCASVLFATPLTAPRGCGARGDADRYGRVIWDTCWTTDRVLNCGSGRFASCGSAREGLESPCRSKDARDVVVVTQLRRTLRNGGAG
jgi:hypothetical protein